MIKAAARARRVINDGSPISPNARATFANVGLGEPVYDILQISS